MKKLKEKLERIHKKQYGIYRSLRGIYRFPHFNLKIEHVQADPFASPSRLAVFIPFTETLFPEEWLTDSSQRIALGDFIIRKLQCEFKTTFSEIKTEKIKGGNFLISKPTNQILKRSNVQFEEGQLVIRFHFHFPAWGRIIHSEYATQQILTYLPSIIFQHCFFHSETHQEISEHIQLYTDQVELQEYLQKNNYLAFIPNEAILARQHGEKQKNQIAKSNSIPFQSPSNLEHKIQLKSGKILTGMLLKPGIHLIIGGGFHGKSTILEAIKNGIFPHIKGDGREFVTTLLSATHIKAESGRIVHSLDISPFIHNLPFEQSNTNFSTHNASGSTSQASSIMENILAQSRLLLLDEDTCATNLMVKDTIMSKLIQDTKDPIQTLTQRIEEIYQTQKVSFIIVMGSISQYFNQAHSILKMHNFEMQDVTLEAKKLVDKQVNIALPICSNLIWKQNRIIEKWKSSSGKIDTKIKVTQKILKINQHEIDCNDLEQIYCSEQLYSIGAWISVIQKEQLTDFKEILEWIDIAHFEGRFQQLPLQFNYAEVRGIDVLTVLNRYHQIIIAHNSNTTKVLNAS